MAPRGEFVANELLGRGLRVVAIESELMGGECADWGCVPTQMMVRAANLLAEAGRVNTMAGSATATQDGRLVATRIREVAAHNWTDGASVVDFERKGGRFTRRTARLVDANHRALDRWEDESGAIGRRLDATAVAHEVDVDGRRFTARLGVVIATGARSVVPDITGLAGLPYWNNRDVVRLEQPPNSFAILDGGAVAVELGQLLARFRVAVTIAEVADLP